MRSRLPWKRFLFKQQDSDLSEQPPDVMAANGSKTLIAFRTFGKGGEMEQSSRSARAGDRPSEASYEVHRSFPRNCDSFIGGLDILTIHRMLKEQNTGNAKQESSESD